MPVALAFVTATDGTSLEPKEVRSQIRCTTGCKLFDLSDVPWQTKLDLPQWLCSSWPSSATCTLEYSPAQAAQSWTACCLNHSKPATLSHLETMLFTFHAATKQAVHLLTIILFLFCTL